MVNLRRNGLLISYLLFPLCGRSVSLPMRCKKDALVAVTKKLIKMLSCCVKSDLKDCNSLNVFLLKSSSFRISYY